MLRGNVVFILIIVLNWSSVWLGSLRILITVNRYIVVFSVQRLLLHNVQDIFETRVFYSHHLAELPHISAVTRKLLVSEPVFLWKIFSKFFEIGKLDSVDDGLLVLSGGTWCPPELQFNVLFQRLLNLLLVWRTVSDVIYNQSYNLRGRLRLQRQTRSMLFVVHLREDFLGK